MFIWKLEDMKLMEMPRMSKDYDAPFACEADVSTEDKFLFVDTMQNGLLSYITNLVKAYREAIPQMKKDAFGNPSSYARKAWVRQNDTQDVLCREANSCWNYGDFILLNTEGNLFTYPNSIGAEHVMTDAEFIDVLFHKQLIVCYDAEYDYAFSVNKECQALHAIRDKYYTYDLDTLCFKRDLSMDFDICLPRDRESQVTLHDYGAKAHKKLNQAEIQRLAASLASLDDLYAQLQEATHAFEIAREATFETMKGLVN